MGRSGCHVRYSVYRPLPDPQLRSNCLCHEVATSRTYQSTWRSRSRVTPASVSVITQKEIERRDARTLEDVLQYSAGAVTDYYGNDDRNDYYLVRGFQASTYRDGITLGSMRGIREESLAYKRVEVIRGADSPRSAWRTPVDRSTSSPSARAANAFPRSSPPSARMTERRWASISAMC